MLKLKEKTPASMDRFEEAHFHLHAMEQYYHFADEFRWSLGGFLRSLKEVPQLIAMELQNEPGFSEWYRGEREVLRNDPLLHFLAKHRDFIVHRGMLLPNSSGAVGITKGNGIKFGLVQSIDPQQNSDTAMRRYLWAVKNVGEDICGVLPDDDGSEDENTLPCVERVWRLEPFKEDVLELSAKAWLRLGEAICAVALRIGCEEPRLSLSCLHPSQKVQLKLYSRRTLKEWYDRLPNPENKETANTAARADC
ncbi:MAG TPA: hypothetical protein VKM72_18450 [Thermoanaerobaculia bacterium]|nr:hypothetical protein [Thermoanaerobaculia bacterium]